MTERFSKDKQLKDGSGFKKLSPTASLLQEVGELGGVDATKSYYETRGAEKVAQELMQFVGAEIADLRNELNVKPSIKRVK